MSSQSQRLSDTAVLGVTIGSDSIGRVPTIYTMSPQSRSALEAGDVTALLQASKSRFGGLRMMADEDDEDEDSEDEDEDSDEEDEDSEDEDEDSDDDDNEDDGPEGKKSKKRKTKDDSPEGLKAKVAALEDEKNRLYRGRKRAQDERDELSKQLEKLKKDGQGDPELKKQVADQEKSISSLTSQLREARIQAAFLSDNTYTWQNPGLALKAANLSDLEIDDDGTVHGLKAALEALVKDNQYLLKPKTTKRVSNQQSGRPPAKKKVADEKRRQQEIADKYRIRK